MTGGPQIQGSPPSIPPPINLDAESETAIETGQAGVAPASTIPRTQIDTESTVSQETPDNRMDDPQLFEPVAVNSAPSNAHQLLATGSKLIVKLANLCFGGNYSTAEACTVMLASRMRSDSTVQETQSQLKQQQDWKAAADYAGQLAYQEHELQKDFYEQKGMYDMIQMGAQIAKAVGNIAVLGATEADGARTAGSGLISGVTDSVSKGLDGMTSLAQASMESQTAPIKQAEQMANYMMSLDQKNYDSCAQNVQSMRQQLESWLSQYQQWADKQSQINISIRP